MPYPRLSDIDIEELRLPNSSCAGFTVQQVDALARECVRRGVEAAQLRVQLVEVEREIAVIGSLLRDDDITSLACAFRWLEEHVKSGTGK